MKLKSIAVLLFVVVSLSFSPFQKEKLVKIVGKVTNFENKPISKAIIYIDSVKTEVTTNKRGFYKIKLSSKVKDIGVFSEQYGLLSTNYTGERKIDFVFRGADDAVAVGGDMRIGVVYKTDLSKPKNNVNRGANYEEFASVTQLLNARFPFVVFDEIGGLRIGKGPNSFGADPTPLIIIERQRSNLQALLTLPTIDIKDIKVIRRGSEAATYGSLGASNGVIIVTLKGDKG